MGAQARGETVSGLIDDGSIAIFEGGAAGGTCIDARRARTKTLVASGKGAA